jgi:hypothetical protein
LGEAAAGKYSGEQCDLHGPLDEMRLG